MIATTWVLSAMEVMWRSALTVIPPALLVAGICRWGGCRPATRHLLWLVVLLMPAALPFLTLIDAPTARPQPIPDVVDEPAPEVEQVAIESPEPPASPEPTNSIEPVDHEVATLPGEPQPAAESDDEAVPSAAGPADEPRTERELTDVRAGSNRPLVLARGPAPAERPSQPTSIEIEPSSDSTGGGEAFAAFPGVSTLDSPRGESVTALWGNATRTLRLGLATGLQSVKTIAETAIQQLQRVMPPAPVRLWLVGGGLLLMMHVIGVLRFDRLRRRARPAGAEISNMVAESAAALGLRRVPSAWLSDDQVSPMVGGLIFPRLIFPAPLWAQLDQPGRRAILVHELAHLHRRDHWVRAIESAVIAVFWWHPAIWWARRRVREEAEVCCDAWVTWLLPHGRRAYATALLKTQTFVGNSAAPSSGSGIGVVSVRARRFARRLTMVMSDSGKPRLSPLAVLLAFVPVLLAWAAAPVLSCPPKATPESDATAAMEPSPAPAPCPEATPTPSAMGGPYQSYQSYLQTQTPRPIPNLVSNLYSQLVGSTLGTMQQPRPRAGGDRDNLEARLDRLERQLDALSRRLESMGSARGPTPPVATAMRGAAPVAIARSADGPVVGKVYRLSGGKLEPLTQLMIREDVPIKVRPMGDAIEIFATPGQHQALAGFIAIIDPSQSGGVIVAPRARSAGNGNSSSNWVAPQGFVVPDMKAHAKATKAAAKALEAQRRALEKQAEKLREQSEKLQERADELKNDARSDAGPKIQELHQKSLAMATEAEMREKQLAEVESQLDAVSDATEAIEASSSDDKDNDDGEDVISDLRAKAESNEKDGSTWFKLGFALHSAGKYDEARKAFERSADLDYNKMQSLYNVACGYARSGDSDQAMVWLKKAWDAGFTDPDQYKNDDDLASLRNDPRFNSLLESKNEAP